MGVRFPRSKLMEQNPWWIDRESWRGDRDIRRFEASRIRWMPHLLSQFNLESAGIYTLRGPRQVGKTTLLKLMIGEAIKKSVDPRRIFYWSCDLIESAAAIAELVESYHEVAEGPGHRLILLDEVSSIRDWQKGVKHLADTGLLSETTLILTGSHSLDIRSAVERLPGRRGEAGGGPFDKVMLPMKFSEYLESGDETLRSLIDSLDLKRIENRKRIIDDLLAGREPPEVKELSLHTSALNKFLEDYLITGGLPIAINNYLSSNRIHPETYAVYVEALRGDVMRRIRRETYLVQLLRRLIDITGSQVSWRSLLKETDIGSVHTVENLIETLTASFVLSQVYSIDASKGSPAYGREKKILFRDPFIFHALRGWVHQTEPFRHSLDYNSSPEVGRLIEGVVNDHVVRLSYSLNPSDLFEPEENVTYWKSKKGEVDIILRTPERLIPIEVKHSNRPSKSDLQGLYIFLKGRRGERGLVLTKTVIEIDEETTMIPTALFLVLT